MAVACTSRFAVLKIEEHFDEPTENVAAGNKNKTPKAATNAKPAQNVQQNNAKTKKKKKSAVEAAELQSLVFGTGSSKSKNSTQTTPQNQKKKSKGQANPNQWQEWKVKDDKFVTDVFEQDLQEALLMSKIDYEEKKEVLDVVRKESESDVSESKKKKKTGQKKEKQTTMTLDAFQNLLPSQLESGNFDPSPASPGSAEEKRVLPPETDFFDKIEEDAEKIIMKEHKMETFKKHQPFIAEHARSLQYQELLEQKDKIIEEQKVQLKQLQEELKGAKYRNKKLCRILSHGEIRDKAEILVQADRLTQVRDELTEEVQQLHAALEQERSKVHSLQMELKKQGHRKEAKEAK